MTTLHLSGASSNRCCICHMYVFIQCIRNNLLQLLQSWSDGAPRIDVSHNKVWLHDVRLELPCSHTAGVLAVGMRFVLVRPYQVLAGCLCNTTMTSVIIRHIQPTNFGPIAIKLESHRTSLPKHHQTLANHDELSGDRAAGMAYYLRTESMYILNICVSMNCFTNARSLGEKESR